jgi:GntR family transcriptional regulator
VSATPLYRRIANQLRDAISTGLLRPGSRLRTEAELMADHAVSRDTIRKAIRELVEQGLVETRGRQGTFVRQHQMLIYRAAVAEQADRPLTGEARDAFFEEVLAQGRKPSQDFSMVIEPAAPDVAARLGVDEGDLVVARAAKRLVDDRPWSDQVSYYPMDVSQTAGLTTPRDIPEGTVRAMAQAGHVEIGTVDEVTARMPTPDEARELDIDAGVPVLLYYRTTYSDQRPLRLTRTLFPADRNTIVYELGNLTAYYQDLKIAVDQDQVR